MKKSILISGAVVTAGLAGLMGAQAVNAANDPSGPQNLIDKISATFKLNKNDVRKVFDEDRKQHQAEHKRQVNDQLAQAVKDGKLTQDQADKLLAKSQEMKAFHESLKDKTSEERHAALEPKMKELKTWMEDNNIPSELRILAGPGMVMKMHDGPAPENKYMILETL